MVQYMQINKYNTAHKNTKDKNHMIISIDAEKAFDNVQHPFMVKSTHQSENRGSIPQHNKSHIQETSASVILCGQN